MLRNTGDKRPSQEIKMLSDIRRRLTDPEATPDTIAQTLVDLSSLLSVILKISDAIELVSTLIHGWDDPDEPAALGSTEVSSALILLQGKSSNNPSNNHSYHTLLRNPLVQTSQQYNIIELLLQNI